MARITSLPHPALRTYIESYWAVARDFDRHGAFDVTPDRYAELVFTRSQFSVRVDEGSAPLSSCFLVKLLKAPLRLEATGIVRCAAVRLHPGGVRPLLGDADMMGSAPIVDLRARIGRTWLDQLLDALGSAAWVRVVAILDELFLSRLGDQEGGINSPVSAFAAVSAPSAATIARQMRVSRRQVERRVRQSTGWSPKQLSALARFQFVRDALWDRPERSLAELAIDAGYADQPHMCRQFRRYSGMTIRQFMDAMRARRDWLNSDPVAFIQDAADAGQ